jgi:cell division protein FtsW (lipid II flippase)
MSGGGSVPVATGIAAAGRRRYTPSELRSAVRSFTRARISLFTPAWCSVVAALGLSILGIMAIGSVAPAEASRQVAFLCLGVIAATGATIVHYRVYRAMAPLFMLLVLLLLVVVLLPFMPEAIVRPRNGARRWITLPMGFEFQPSELAKVAYVLVLGIYLTARRHYRRFLGISAPLVLTFIPMALILKEPDLGTSLLFLPTLFAMLVVAGSRLHHLLIIALLGACLGASMLPLLEDHQKDRIAALVDHWSGAQSKLQDEGFQGHKAMTLVGAGGLTGLGAEDGRTLVTGNRLPEDHNDMIFAVISVRWGFVGAAATWGLYVLLGLGVLLTAAQTSDPYGRLVVIGLGAMVLTQMVVNTGMTIGLLPITGMTLPFVSYGGSSLVSAWAMIGVILSIGLRWPQYLARQAVDFDTFETEDAA